MRTTSSVALAVVLSLAAAGCGSSKATTSATTAAGAATTAAAAAAVAATTASPATTAPATTAAAAGAATTAAAVTTTQAAAFAGNKNVTIAVITNGDGRAFWGQVQQGAEQAGKDLGIKVTYEGANNNAEVQAKLIEEAAINKVSGIAISVADAKAVSGAAAKVTNANIPMVTFNSGVEQYKELGAITHIGQSERDAGRGAGERLKTVGGKVMLCVRPDNSVGQAARCQGASEAFAPGKVVELVTTGGPTLDASQAEVKAKLAADASIDAVLATSPGDALLARKAAVELNRKITVGAVDLSGPAWKLSSRATLPSRSISSSTRRATCRLCCCTSVLPRKVPRPAASRFHPGRASSTRQMSWPSKNSSPKAAVSLGPAGSLGDCWAGRRF
jgi:simple sugar transport system substrate-binding protein